MTNLRTIPRFAGRFLLYTVSASGDIGYSIMLKKLPAIFAGFALTLVAYAATVELKPGHPDTYVVRRGDTLSEIAETLRVSVSSLRSWNNINGNSIRAGQKLVAYVPRRS